MEARQVPISKVRARRAERPNATLLCRRIVADMVRKLPELSHVRASRVLFVAARRAAVPAPPFGRWAEKGARASW